MPSKNVVLFGELIYATGPAATATLSPVRCSLTYDLHDTSSLTVDLHAGEGLSIDYFTIVQLANSGVMMFESKDGSGIRWNGLFGGSSMGGHTDRFASAKIQELFVPNRRDAENADRYKFIYYVTDTELFKRRTQPVRDSRRGLMYNVDISKTDVFEFAKADFYEERYPFTIGEWTVTFKPTVRIEEQSEHTFVLQDALIAVVEVQGGKFIEREQEARKVINSFMHIISVFECRTVEWRSCEMVGYVGEGNMASIDADLIVARHPQEFDVDSNVFVDAPLYHAQLERAAGKWLVLSEEENEELQGIVQPYLDSNRPMIGLALRIVRLHTTIEALTHYLELPDKGSASQRWLKVMETLKIDWQKYYPEMKREEILKKKNASNFALTEWRNTILHQGSLPETIPLYRILKELRRVQKVVRKCIAAIMEYTDPEVPERKMPSMTVTRKDGESISFGATE